MYRTPPTLHSTAEQWFDGFYGDRPGTDTVTNVNIEAVSTVWIIPMLLGFTICAASLDSDALIAPALPMGLPGLSWLAVAAVILFLGVTMAVAGGTIAAVPVGFPVGVLGAQAPADSGKPRDRGATALQRGQQLRVEQDQLFGRSRLRQRRRRLSSSGCAGHGVLDGVARALGAPPR